MFDKIKALYLVLQAGESLKNPEVWKQRQALYTLLVPILGAIPQFVELPIPIPQESIRDISMGAATIFTVIWNLYLTYATSKKVGL